MENVNLLTGEPVLMEENQFPTFKKMCLNCEFCNFNEAENGEPTCINSENLEGMKAKMLEAISGVTEAYAVTNFEIKPLPLKKPCNKCSKWALSEMAVERFRKSFV